jgi:hypothetical protein
MPDRLALALTLGASLLTASGATACESATTKRTDAGFIFKVVGDGGKIEAKVEPGGTETAFVLAPLTSYVVICEQDQFYRIASLPARTMEQAQAGPTGYVGKDDVFPWSTREALNFMPLLPGGDRPEIVAWDNYDSLRRFVETGNVKEGPPAYHEDLQSALKRERAARPYPVLGGWTEKLRGSVDKRAFNVLLPPAVQPDAKIVITPDAGKGDTKDSITQGLQRTMTRTTVVIAFDATADNDRFASSLAQQLKREVAKLPRDMQDALQVGLVFFRDESDDEKYLIIEPQSVSGAVSGDPPEPVLDAVYIAHHLFPWGDAGRRLIIAVLAEDAKPATTGKIHDGVPAGLGPANLASDLAADRIPVLTVQNWPTAGANLVPVLSTLGEGTGGKFLEWSKGANVDLMTAALVNQLLTMAKDSFVDGNQVLSSLDFDSTGAARIPLAVLDGEKLDRMRKAGFKFEVDPGKGGAAMRSGFLLENGDLLEPVIRIDKPTLERLIGLFAALGTTGIDAEVLKVCTSQVLSAIAGEDYDPNEDIDVTIKKRLGIQFRTGLLDFNIEHLAGMNRDERLAMARRIQKAGIILAQFLDAHLEELDRSSAVWMPVSWLP